MKSYEILLSDLKECSYFPIKGGEGLPKSRPSDGQPPMRRAARANAHTSCTSHSTPERRLWPECLVVKSNHPYLERLCFEQFQLRPIRDALKERDSTA